jgi:hypothetical protein
LQDWVSQAPTLPPKSQAPSSLIYGRISSVLIEFGTFQ